ncbi:MAG: metallopeptidase, partial [Desulfurococcales archaeon ex4484_58]
MIKYVYADDVKALAKDIIDTLPDYLGYIDLTRVFFIRSYGSRTTAVARIHA